MIYLFHESAGAASISLEGDAFKHMIKARRQSVGDTLILRKSDDEHNYIYTIINASKKDATLSLLKKVPAPKQISRPLHLGWSLIDPKSIEKVLPALCELGVTEISFIYANRSQKNFTLDAKRLDRIIINSMQQCGRYDKMQLHDKVKLSDFIAQNPQTVVLDFCETVLNGEEHFSSILLGPEGGFDAKERELLKGLQVRRLDTPMVLRSETAAVAIVAKILL